MPTVFNKYILTIYVWCKEIKPISEYVHLPQA